MKGRIAVFWLLLMTSFVPGGSLLGAAQDQPAPAEQASATADNKPITVKGCLTGEEGRYTIGTARDDLYLLQGDIAQFKRYNGKMVEVIGTLSPSTSTTSNRDVLSQQPPELHVTSLKKLANRCAN